MFRKLYNLFLNHYLTKYFGVYRHAKQLFIFDIVLLLLASILLASGAFFIFWRPGPIKDVHVNISFGSERIVSGSDVKLTIEYLNNSEKFLHNSILSVRLPKGFKINDPAPAAFDPKNSTYEIGELPPGSGGKLELFGRLWSNVNQTEKIIATLSFLPDNDKATSKVYGAYILKLSESIIGANLDIPNRTYSNSKLNYTINLANKSSEDLNNIKIIVNGNEKKSIDLSANSSTSTTESFISPAKGGQYFLVTEIKISVNGQTFTQAVLRGNVELVTPRVSIGARTTENISFVDNGTTIPIEILWKNENQAKLTDQKIILQTTPGIIDLSATALENHLEKNGDKLIVSSKTRTALSNGNPNNNDTFTLKLIAAKNFDNKAYGVNKLSIRPVFEAKTENISDQTFTVEGAPIEIPLAGEVYLRTETRYYTDEGDQLGRGPLPPQVGKATKYWIYGTLFVKTNPVAANKLTFTLAPGVTFTGKQSVTIGPELIYDETNRTITWNYGGVIPADSESGFYFEVSVTPTEQQIGYILNLVEDATYYGIDDIVGKVFSIDHGNTANILQNTDRGSLKGAKVIQ